MPPCPRCHRHDHVVDFDDDYSRHAPSGFNDDLAAYGYAYAAANTPHDESADYYGDIAARLLTRFDPSIPLRLRGDNGYIGENTRFCFFIVEGCDDFYVCDYRH
ncbi:unnamed protein product [Rotaria sp. Silwood1]|nr:unnamed protein product [Rotaria sp. Silwood1]CAF5054834.1 unnamed protein product [Rotaria sp. Silwood1]